MKIPDDAVEAHAFCDATRNETVAIYFVYGKTRKAQGIVVRTTYNGVEHETHVSAGSWKWATIRYNSLCAKAGKECVFDEDSRIINCA